MKKQRGMGKIAFIILLFIVSLCFVFLNIFDFKIILFSSDFSNQLFLMFLYAVIPCVFAVILRVIFGARSLKWIAFAATVLAGLCCLVHITLPETILEEKVILYEDAGVVIYSYVNEWIFVFTQCTLTSSVPVLYCIAFVGDLYCFPFVKKGQSILVILAPSLMFFLSLFIRYVMSNGFLETFEFILDESILMLLLLSVAFAVWALLLIFISHMIYMFLSPRKIEN